MLAVQMMDILEQHCRQLLGPEFVERIANGAYAVQLHEAILRFNAPDR